MRVTRPASKLGDVLIPVDRSVAVDPTSEYRLLGIRLDGKGPFHRETVLGSQTSAARLRRVATGDFIYSRLFACRGAFGVIEQDLDGCYVSGEFPTFMARPGLVDVQFLRHWFRLPSTIARVDEDCTGSTPLTRNRFKERFFLALEIPLPPLSEQRRIVARIESVSSKILEARAIRAEILSETRSILTSSFKQVSEGAQFISMGEIAPIIRRQVDLRMSESYPELGIRSFGRGTFHKPALSYIDVGTKKLFKIEPGDLVFSNVFAWEGAIAVAQPGDCGRFGSHRFITCVPRKGVALPEYLCFYFLTKDGLGKIQDASPGGAGRNRTLGLEKLSMIAVPIPEYHKQLWFMNILARATEMTRISEQSNNELDALLPSVLDRAFKGEL